MATRKRNAPKGKPKGSGGQSGGGNPRNDGRITEQQHDEAMRVLRAEYYQSVRGISQDLADRIKDGELSSQDDLDTAVNEAVDGSYWVIYTHANFQVLMCSDHHDAYSEDFGDAPVEGSDIKWAALAYAAMMRDVQEQMSAEGVEVDERDSDLNERRRPHRRTPPPGPSRTRHRAAPRRR